MFRDPRKRGRERPTAAALLSYTALFLFVTIFLFLGLFNHVDYSYRKKKPKYDFPDFNSIQSFTRVLSGNEVNFDDTHNRVIIMGDVHGMNKSLHNILDGLSFDPTHDTVFFAGDLLAKSRHSTSISVIDFLTKHHQTYGKESMFPVRGNHDHLIVQWRTWREWFEGLTHPLQSTSPTPRLFSAYLNSLKRVVPSVLERAFAGSAIANTFTPRVATGLEFLQLIEAEWAIARVENDVDPEEYADVARKRSRGTWREEWWSRIPPSGTGKEKQQWRMFGDHYWLARDITLEQASYLKSLPIVLHVPRLHLFVAHAGILPSDPRLAPTDSRQPLAHPPSRAESMLNYADGDDQEKRALLSRLQAHLYSQEASDASPLTPALQRPPTSPSSSTDHLRTLQESAVLHDVPQNRNPWVVLNMRSVTKKHKVTRNGDKGTPWSKIWNEQMRSCRGFDGKFAAESSDAVDVDVRDAGDVKGGKGAKYELPCYPSTVVYGHAATRGLDVKRWSMGLDTGCLYGRKLTALVLNNATALRNADEGWFEDEDEDDEEDDDDDDEDEEEHEDDSEEDDDDDETDSKPKGKHVRFGDSGSGISAHLFSIRCPDIDFDA